MKLTRPWILLLASSTIAGTIAIACGGDDTTAIAPAGDDGGTPDGSTPTGDGSVPTDDGSSADDGGAQDGDLLPDGGDNPPEDGGDPDGGFDAGPACERLEMGPDHTTTCSTATPASLKGGALTAGTFQLTDVKVYGLPIPRNFCGDGGAYKSFDHRGVLVIKTTSTSQGTFEFQERYHRTASALPTFTERYDVAVGAVRNTLGFVQQPCQAPDPPPSGANFETGSNRGGTKFIILRIATGRGGVSDYRFEQQ